MAIKSAPVIDESLPVRDLNADIADEFRDLNRRFPQGNARGNSDVTNTRQAVVSNPRDSDDMARRERTVATVADDIVAFNAPSIFDGFGPTSGPHTFPIEALAPSPSNPRKKFPAGPLRELADSLAEIGQKQRILVRPVEPRQHVAKVSTENKADWCVFKKATGGAHELVRRVTGPEAETIAEDLARILSRAPYQITGGERRWHALRMIGRATALVEVEDSDDKEALINQITENSQREGVTAMEEADACQKLLDMGMSQGEIAKRMGWSPSKVSKRVALGKLPPEVRGLIDSGRIEPSYGDRLQTYNGFPRVQVAIADAIARNPDNWRAADLDGSMARKIVDVLKSSKLARELNYETKFKWKEICPNCPFGAFRKHTYGDAYGVCLKIGHFDELQREAKRVEKEAYDAAAAEALRKAQADRQGRKPLPMAGPTAAPTKDTKETPALPVSGSLDLSAAPEPVLPVSAPKLPLIKEYGQGAQNMRVILIPGVGTKTGSYADGYNGNFYQRPPGCDAAVCECAGQAMYVPHGDVKRLRVLDVCTNAKRFDDLCKAAKVAEKQNRRERLMKRAGQATELLVEACADPRKATGSRVLAAALFTQRQSKTWEIGKEVEKSVADFLGRLPCGAPLTIFGRESTVSVAKLQDAGANVLEIVAFAAWFEIHAGIDRAAEYDHNTPVLDAILLAGKEEAKARGVVIADEDEEDKNA